MSKRKIKSNQKTPPAAAASARADVACRSARTHPCKAPPHLLEQACLSRRIRLRDYCVSGSSCRAVTICSFESARDRRARARVRCGPRPLPWSTIGGPHDVLPIADALNYTATATFSCTCAVWKLSSVYSGILAQRIHSTGSIKCTQTRFMCAHACVHSCTVLCTEVILALRLHTLGCGYRTWRGTDVRSDRILTDAFMVLR